MKLPLRTFMLGLCFLAGCNQQGLVLEEKNPDGIVFSHEKKVGDDPFLGFKDDSQDQGIEYYHLLANHVPKGKTYRLVVHLPDGTKINGGEYKVLNGVMQSTDKSLKLSEVLITATNLHSDEKVDCYLIALDNSNCVKTSIEGHAKERSIQHEEIAEN